MLSRPSFWRTSCGFGSQMAHWRLISYFAAAKGAARKRMEGISVSSFIFKNRLVCQWTPGWDVGRRCC